MENSAIEWTNHTFNPWWGCMKVSEGCKNCYAATLDNRYHKNDSHWGPGSSRKQQSNKYWNEPLKWNKAAEMADKQAMVFCASMADVFEVSEDPVVLEGRARLFKLIEDTPHLIWQLLTKRPENILPSIPMNWRFHGIPSNVWLGTSVENQDVADERIPALIWTGAKITFLSCEPLLGPLDISRYLGDNDGGPVWVSDDGEELWPIKWVIVGGESGHGARPMHPTWPRSIKDQCEAAEIPFFFKQWGEFTPWHNITDDHDNFYAWKDDVFQVKFAAAIGLVGMKKVGKQMAGSLLDNNEYKNFPKSEDDE